MLVNALVIPHIEFACAVFNNVPDYSNLKLQPLMNAGIRLIYNLQKDTSIIAYR